LENAIQACHLHVETVRKDNRVIDESILDSVERCWKVNVQRNCKLAACVNEIYTSRGGYRSYGCNASRVSSCVKVGIAPKLCLRRRKALHLVAYFCWKAIWRDILIAFILYLYREAIGHCYYTS
jgi:hypothetical protein